MKILIPVIVLAVLGGALGVLIGVFSKFFAVKEDTRIEEIIHLLPGANCGGCGFPGCSGMADAIVNGDASPRQCKPIKQEKIDEIQFVLDEFNRLSVENSVDK